ncbi:MAG: hypothetical protein QME45_11635 [Clostridiales bacterium]|nr:hypothetical protein [Clostridiales bacterium]
MHNNRREIKEQYTKWWNKELDKPLLQLMTENKDAENRAKGWNGFNFLIIKDDPERVIKEFECSINNSKYLCSSYPEIWLNLGPGVMAAYITGYLGFNGHSAWFEHPMEWEDIEKSLNFIDEDNDWWKYTLKIAELTAKKASGKYSVGTTDIGGIIDILASLRTTQTLLLELIDQPEKVLAAEEKILKLWFYVYDRVNEKIEKYCDGYDAWMGIWCPKKWYPLQADFSAMISPKMYRQFIEPFIREQTKRLDYSIYHLDGPGEIPHLDILLDIDELDGIQWVPGAGNLDVTSEAWYDIYRRIQKKGKNIVLNGADPKKIQDLFKHISPKGVLVSTYCSNEDADMLMDWYTKTYD